ncbi:hypothetical protein ACJJTC_014785 [Scirpophaga incertulas]
MMSKRVAVTIAVVLAAICLAEARDDVPSAHDMADALRMLQELDRIYTQAARPRRNQQVLLSFAKITSAFSHAHTLPFVCYATLIANNFVKSENSRHPVEISVASISTLALSLNIAQCHRAYYSTTVDSATFCVSV